MAGFEDFGLAALNALLQEAGCVMGCLFLEAWKQNPSTWTISEGC